MRQGPPSGEAGSCWNEPEQVERFAVREPDHRLAALWEGVPDPAAVRVLDLGCAGGRNTEALAARGFDVQALDAAEAMVAHTRARLTPIVGADEAERRVVLGEMRDLSAWAAGAFDLVVALGVLHQAQDEEEWYASLAEIVRVLAPGGRVLVSNFAPGTGPVETPLALVPGTSFVHEGFRGDHLCLRRAADLDADFRSLGLEADVATAIVEREGDGRRRVTVNALYRRP